MASSDYSIHDTKIDDLIFVPIYQINGSAVFRVGRVMSLDGSQQVQLSFNWPFFVESSDSLQPIPELEGSIFTLTNCHLQIWLPCEYLRSTCAKNYTIFLTHRRLRKTVLRTFRKALALYVQRKAADSIKSVWLERAYRYPDGVMFKKLAAKYANSKSNSTT